LCGGAVANHGHSWKEGQGAEEWCGLLCAWAEGEHFDGREFDETGFWEDGRVVFRFHGAQVGDTGSASVRPDSQANLGQAQVITRDDWLDFSVFEFDTSQPSIMERHKRAITVKAGVCGVSVISKRISIQISKAGDPQVAYFIASIKPERKQSGQWPHIEQEAAASRVNRRGRVRKAEVGRAGRIWVKSGVNPAANDTKV
jgi:hypothetical protein